MAKLTGEEQEIFYEYEKMFDSVGWKQLTEELEKELEALPSVAFLNAKNYEEIIAHRVRARVVAEILHYPTLIEARKEALLIERDQEEQEARFAESNRGL